MNKLRELWGRWVLAAILPALELDREQRKAAADQALRKIRPYIPSRLEAPKVNLEKTRGGPHHFPPELIEELRQQRAASRRARQQHLDPHSNQPEIEMSAMIGKILQRSNQVKNMQRSRLMQRLCKSHVRRIESVDLVVENIDFGGCVFVHEGSPVRLRNRQFVRLHRNFNRAGRPLSLSLC